MTASKVSLGEAIRFGWSTALSNLGVYVPALLIVIAMGMFPVFFDSVVVPIVSWLFSVVVSLGIMRLTLRFVDGGKGELADLFTTFSLVPRWLIASIIVSILASLAFLLFIIPGIYVGLRLQFYSWAIVDKEAGAIESIQTSWDIARGQVWRLFLLGLALAGINLLGALALGVGLLVTVPLSILAMAHVYRQLESTSRR